MPTNSYSLFSLHGVASVVVPGPDTSTKLKAHASGDASNASMARKKGKHADVDLTVDSHTSSSGNSTAAERRLDILEHFIFLEKSPRPM